MGKPPRTYKGIALSGEPSERSRQYGKMYYRDNREKVIATVIRSYKKHRVKRDATKRTYRISNPNVELGSRLKKLYGITLSEYTEMVNSRGGLCEICKTKPSKGRLCVDHCHSSGAIRGLLCPQCNSGLGFFGDSTDTLATAIQYLATFTGRAK